jgi:hypothetical protein
MKQLNEVAHIKAQLSAEERQAALDYHLIAQLQGFEKMMENNGAYVQSPVAYNHCIGLIDQLKYYALASFRPAEGFLDPDNLGSHQRPSDLPLYGKP